MASILYNNDKIKRVTPINIKSKQFKKFKNCKICSNMKSSLNQNYNNNNTSDSDDSDNDNNRKFSCIKNFYDFCSKTSLHGLKFVGDTKLSNIERIFFVITFVTAFGMSMQFTYNIYAKWLSTPVIIGFSSTTTSINTIPFPAITICNMNQAQSSKVKHLNTKTAEYSILQTLCSREDTFDENELNSTRDWSLYEKFINEVAQPCKNMLISCQFGSVFENCNELFRTVMTDEGLCCAFNTVDSSLMYTNMSNQQPFFTNYDPPRNNVAVNWTPEKNYPKKLPKNVYPRPAKGIGFNMGLSLILDAQLDEYYCSSTNGPGFKILLHNPVEIPNVGSSGISVKIGYETRIVIHPEINIASDALKSMKKQNRRCIFEHESNLTYFSTYTRRNCELECESRVIAKQCNCVNFYMPRIPPNISVCGAIDSECFDDASAKAQNLDDDDDIGIDCNKECLNSCYDLTFAPDAFSAPIGYGNFTIRDQIIQDMSNNYVTNNIAVIHFYYMEKAFRSNIKEQFIGLTEFLSSTGGIIGLFLGFSFTSFIEIVYYSTLRPICYCRKLQIKRKQVEVQKNLNSKSEPIRMIFNKRNYNQNLNNHYDNTINNVWRTKKLKNNNGTKIKGGPIFRINSGRTLPGVLPYIE